MAADMVSDKVFRASVMDSCSRALLVLGLAAVLGLAPALAPERVDRVVMATTVNRGISGAKMFKKCFKQHVVVS